MTPRASFEDHLYDKTGSCFLRLFRYDSPSIRSGLAKVGSGNLVWRSQGALDAVAEFCYGDRCANVYIRTEFLSGGITFLILMR